MRPSPISFQVNGDCATNGNASNNAIGGVCLNVPSTLTKPIAPRTAAQPRWQVKACFTGSLRFLTGSMHGGFSGMWFCFLLELYILQEITACKRCRNIVKEALADYALPSSDYFRCRLDRMRLGVECAD